MKKLDDNKQMPDVWHLPAIARWEKSCGKPPTQKTLSLFSLIILASTPEQAWILDSFCGSTTTDIVASLLGFRFLGIDREISFLEMAKLRREKLNDEDRRKEYSRKIRDLSKLN